MWKLTIVLEPEVAATSFLAVSTIWRGVGYFLHYLPGDFYLPAILVSYPFPETFILNSF